MKKLVLLLSVVLCLGMTSCNCGQKKADAAAKDECTKTEQKCQMTEEQKAEMEAFMVQWNDWENLDDATKTDLIAKAKACIDKKAECCKAKEGEKTACCKDKKEGEKACCKDKKEGEKACDPAECEAKKAECEAKKAEMKAKWEAFETLTLDEQKELIDAKMACCKKHCCKKEGEKEGEKAAE